jgi:hypothetical protein
MVALGVGDPLSQYIAYFDPCIGDDRTRCLFRATVASILTSGSTACAQIAAHSPECAGPHGAQCGPHFVHNTTTKRSQLSATDLSTALRQCTIAHLQAAPPAELWLVLDGGDRRELQTRQLGYIDQVPLLDGRIGPGYHILTVLVVVSGLRGLLYQTVYSTRQPGFRSESLEIQTALTSHMQQWQDGHLAETGAQLQRRATLETELEVRLHSQHQAKCQPVMVDLTQCAVGVGSDPSPRTDAPRGQQVWQRANLVEAAIRDDP